MKNSFAPGLVKAVKEYYWWNGDRCAHAVRFVKDAHGNEVLLVRLTDAQGVRLSGLMTAWPWADGHWDVHEFQTADREDEAELIADFQDLRRGSVLV